MEKKLVGLIVATLFIGTISGYSVNLFLTQIQTSTLNEQIDTLQAQVTELQTNLDSNLTKISDLEASLDSNLTKITELVGNLSTLQANLDSNVTKVAQLESIIAGLQAQMKEVYVLEDQEYYHNITSDLQKANETILVAMYSMIYDSGDSFDWANDLINELVNASERGINVTVIIEYRTFFGYQDANLDAYNYLLTNNATVQLDNDTDTDHMKLVIIDDKIVYVGSHNWSESALYYNNETSVKIVSKEIAELFKAYFETI